MTTESWKVDATHPFFEEVAATVGFMNGKFAIHGYEALYEQLGRVVASLEGLIGAHVCRVLGERIQLSGSIQAVSLADHHHIGAEGCDDVLRLKNCLRYVDYAAGRADRPREFSFELVDAALVRAEGTAALRNPNVTEKSGTEFAPRSDELLWGYAIGAKYEAYRDRLRERFGGFRSHSPLLQMFRHVRNGCFHANRFRIVEDSRQPQIDPRCPPMWRSLVMPDDQTMNGRRVIGDFLKAPHILPFMADVGEALRDACGPA